MKKQGMEKRSTTRTQWVKTAGEYRFALFYPLRKVVLRYQDNTRCKNMAMVRLHMAPFSIMSITIIFCSLLLQLYPQKAQAFPCIGDILKEYCIGYHDGAIQAHRDYNNGNDISLDQHRCTIKPEYCKGYDRGYNDEMDFLG